MTVLIRTFVCLIEGDNCLFKVEIAANRMIYDLKDEVHRKASVTWIRIVSTIHWI